MSDWKNVQYKDGKLRTNNGGSGGSSTFAGLDDVNFTNLQNGQVPKYNSTTQEWENANESGGGHTYSTTEQVIGTWIDGKPLYEITLIVPKNIGTGNNVQYAHNIPNIDRVVGFEYGGMLSNGGIYRITYDATYRVWVHEINRTMVVWALGSSIIQYLDSLFVTIQYTKTTD